MKTVLIGMLMGFCNFAGASWLGPGMNEGAIARVNNSADRVAYAEFVLNTEFPELLAEFVRSKGETLANVSCERYAESPSAATLVAKFGNCTFKTMSGKSCTSGFSGGGCEELRPTQRYFECGSGTKTVKRSASAMNYNKRVFKALGCSTYPNPGSFQTGDRWCQMHPIAPACHGNFCSSYPSHPACREANWCTFHPTAPQCRQGP